MATVEERVRQIIVDELGVDAAEVTLSAKFLDDLGADSLDTVELVMAFEEAFNMEIPDLDAVDCGGLVALLGSLWTVKDAVEYIQKNTTPAQRT